MSDKEELISQGAAASRKQAGMVNKALQSRASSTSPIPNLNFLDFQRKIILITEDIKKLRKSSFLMKMKNTLTSSGPSLDGKSHMDGSLLAKTSKKPGLDSIVSELSKDPTSTTSRVKLIRTLMYHSCFTSGCQPNLSDLPPSIDCGAQEKTADCPFFAAEKCQHRHDPCGKPDSSGPGPADWR